MRSLSRPPAAGTQKRPASQNAQTNAPLLRRPADSADGIPAMPSHPLPETSGQRAKRVCAPVPSLGKALRRRFRTTGAPGACAAKSHRPRNEGPQAPRRKNAPPRDGDRQSRRPGLRFSGKRHGRPHLFRRSPAVFSAARSFAKIRAPKVRKAPQPCRDFCHVFLPERNFSALLLQVSANCDLNHSYFLLRQV